MDDFDTSSFQLLIPTEKQSFLQSKTDQEVILGIRPEHMTVSGESGDWKGTVGVSEHLGSDTFFHVNIDGFAEPLTVRAGGEVDLHYGDTIYLTPDPAQIHKFDDDGIRIA